MTYIISQELLEQKVEKIKTLEQTERRQSEALSNLKEVSDNTARKLQEKEKLLEQALAKEQGMANSYISFWESK